MLTSLMFYLKNSNCLTVVPYSCYEVLVGNWVQSWDSQAYPRELVFLLTGPVWALKERRNLFHLLILLIFNSQYKFHFQSFKDPSMHRETVMRSSMVNFLYK